MNSSGNQYTFPFIDKKPDESEQDTSSVISSNNNSLNFKDRAFHDWYRFVLSFPPHLVRDYISDFNLGGDSSLLDPFCGTGTTVVEAKLNKISATGLETNPFPHFASTVKSTWDVDPEDLHLLADQIAESTYKVLINQGIDDQLLACDDNIELRTLEPQALRAIIKNSISPLPLHKTLILHDQIEQYRHSPCYKYFILALGKSLVKVIGNLRFGPEVGVGKIKNDVPVVMSWLYEIHRMVKDLRLVSGKKYPEVIVHLADARNISSVIQPNSVDAVITSPPYPNEKDYTRTTRLESVVLGFIKDMSQLRTYKKTFLRSNTRGVYINDDDDKWIVDKEDIQKVADAIEKRRIELGKTSGFEKLYARVTRLYFGGMLRHLTDLKTVLKPGANLAYVVGDQASYLRVMIRTGKLLAQIADGLGYEIVRIDLFRKRFATATRSELREEVVVMRWPDK